MRLTAACVFVYLQLGGVLPYTLYKWILDSRMRFNYDPDPQNSLGVSNWPSTYSKDCGGLHQSPVNIQTDQVRYGVSCQCPRMDYDSRIMRGELKNNGHSTTFEPESPMVLRLSRIPYLNGTYLFNDFHLHYGGVRGRNFELQGLRFRGSGVMSAGSEHTIDGLRFEGELHFVFYNSKYGTLENADKEPDGVAIIVILVQKVPDMTVNNMRFSSFLERNIPLVAPYLANISTTVDMSMFFNRDCEFYTYPGSTTTPACHESVRWIILKDPIQVTERAWFLLTGLQSRGDFNARFGNYRTTQPLNDRVVEANFRRSEGRRLPMPNSDIVDQQQRMGQTMSMVPVPSSPDGAIPNRQLGIGSRAIGGSRMAFGMGQRGMGAPRMDIGMASQSMGGRSMDIGMGSRGMVGPSMDVGMGSRGMVGPSMDIGMGSRGMVGPSMDVGMGSRGMVGPSMDVGMGSRGMGGPSMDIVMGSRSMGRPSMDIGIGLRRMGGPTMDVGAGSQVMGGPSMDMSFGQMRLNTNVSAAMLGFPQVYMPMIRDFTNLGFQDTQPQQSVMNRQTMGPRVASQSFNRKTQPMSIGRQRASLSNQMRAGADPRVMSPGAVYWKQMMARA